MAQNYYQKEIETMSAEDMKKLQSEKLVKQVKHVYENVAYYRNLMDEKGIKPEDIKEHPLKELLINYDAEVMPGDTVKISRVRQESEEGVVYYITGRVDEKQNFAVKLVF